MDGVNEIKQKNSEYEALTETILIREAAVADQIAKLQAESQGNQAQLVVFNNVINQKQKELKKVPLAIKRSRFNNLPNEMSRQILPFLISGNIISSWKYSTVCQIFFVGVAQNFEARKTSYKVTEY